MLLQMIKALDMNTSMLAYLVANVCLHQAQRFPGPCGYLHYHVRMIHSIQAMKHMI